MGRCSALGRARHVFGDSRLAGPKHSFDDQEYIPDRPDLPERAHSNPALRRAAVSDARPSVPGTGVDQNGRTSFRDSIGVRQGASDEVVGRLSVGMCTDESTEALGNGPRFL
jgi:hypothetical protein